MTFLGKSLNAAKTLEQAYTTRYVPNLSKFEDTGVLAPFSSTQIIRIGDYLYAFGGDVAGSANVATNKIWATPWNNPTAWSNTGYTLPGSVLGANTFVLNDSIYIFGDMQANSSIYRARLSEPLYWSATGCTVNPVNNNNNRGFALNPSDNTIYLFQGYNTNATAAATISYKASASNPLVWSQFSQPGARWELGAATFNNKFLAFGGVSGASALLITSDPKQTNTTDVTKTLNQTYQQTPFAYDAGDDLFILGGSATAIDKISKDFELSVFGGTFVSAGYGYGTQYIGSDGKLYFITRTADATYGRHIYRSINTKVKTKEYSFADNTSTGFTDSGNNISISKHAKLGFAPWLTNKNDLPSVPQETPLDKFGTRLKLWLEADRGITLAVSGRVSDWVDQASGLTFSQVTDGSRPYYDAKWNGKKVLRFTASGETLTHTSVSNHLRYQRANYQHTFACARFVKSGSSVAPFSAAIGTNYVPIYSSGTATLSYKGNNLETFPSSIGTTTFGREIVEINPGAISKLTLNGVTSSTSTAQSDGYTGGTGVYKIHDHLNTLGNQEIACIIDIEGLLTDSERLWLDTYLLRWNTTAKMTNNFSPKDLGGEWWDFDDSVDDGSGNVQYLYGRNNGWVFGEGNITYRMKISTWSDGSKDGYSIDNAALHVLESTDANVINVLKSAEHTFWCVCRPGFSNSGNAQFILGSSGAGQQLSELRFPQDTNLNAYRSVRGSTGSLINYIGNRTMAFQNDYLVGYSQDATTNTLKTDSKSTISALTNYTGDLNLTHVMIGGRSVSGALSSYPFNGHIKAFGFIPRKLTDAEWNSIGRYYQRNMTEIICNGNSITGGGYGEAESYPTILSRMFREKAYVTNLGVGGTTTPAITTSLTTSVPNYLAGTIYNIIWEITNDLAIGSGGSGSSAAVALQNHALCVAKARELGVKNIIAATVIPRTNYDIEAKRLVVNDALRLNPGKIYGDVIADVASRPEFTTWTGTYFVDAAHPNTAGHKVLADEFKNAILTFTSESKPTDIPGIVLWLKADEGVTLDGSNKVSQWNDLSGNNNHMTQSVSGNRPNWNLATDRINNKPTVSTDTSAVQYLRLDSLVPVIATEEYTFICVAKASGAQSYIVVSDAGSFASFEVVQSNGNTNVVNSRDNTSINLAATGQQLFGKANVIAFRSSLAGPQKLNVNNNLFTTAQVRTAKTGLTRFQIGDIWWGGAANEAGAIAEFAMYNRTLTDVETQTVIAGMVARWNI
jgi:hypothetical protein